jgi:hypothetical protein
MRKGERVRGDVAMSRQNDHITHHWAHRGGRMYLCGCIGQFRVGDRVKLPGNVKKRTKVGFDRWLNTGAK